MNFYLYLAGSSNEMDRVKQIAAEINSLDKSLAEHGDRLIITHKWWDVIEDRGEANPAATAHARRNWAVQDIQGVKDADLFWMLWPHEPTGSGGCFWEAGYADSLDTEMITSGPTERSIFAARTAEFMTDAGAFEYLTDIVNNRIDEVNNAAGAA